MIRTTVVGSYPVPAWLAAYPTAPNLRDAILVVLKTQELAGIDVVSDGELSRFDVNHPETNGMIEYFVRPMDGISTELSAGELAEFRRQDSMKFRARPAGVVRGPIGPGTLDLAAEFERVRSLSSKPLKFTLTSPYMLAATLAARDRVSTSIQIASVLAEQVKGVAADVIQVDEANLPGSPQDALAAARAINLVLAGARGDKGVHLCFGNYGGQTIQKGLYRDLLGFFNALECDHLLLEFARRGAPELPMFRDLKPGIALGIGVIDIKDNEVETPEEVARRIDKAISVLGPERVRWVHPDCGFWMLPRTVADRKMRALVQGRDLCATHGT